MVRSVFVHAPLSGSIPMGLEVSSGRCQGAPPVAHWRKTLHVRARVMSWSLTRDLTFLESPGHWQFYVPLFLRIVVQTPKSLIVVQTRFLCLILCMRDVGVSNHRQFEAVFNYWGRGVPQVSDALSSPCVCGLGVAFRPCFDQLFVHCVWMDSVVLEVSWKMPVFEVARD